MNSSSNNNILNSMNPLNFLEFYTYDHEDDELMRIMKILADTNERVYRPRKQVHHVGIQTVPEVDDAYIPWLVEAERKTEEFCVQLCNLKNTLYHSKNSDSKTKRTAAQSSSFPTTRNAQCEKYRPMQNLKSAGYPKLPGGKSENFGDLVFELIENKINSIIESAIELRNSIPKLSLEKLEEYSDCEILESRTVKETNTLKLTRSTSSVNMRRISPPKVYKRSNTLSTIKETKLVEKSQIRELSKQLSQMSCGNGKSDTCFVPKTKNVVKGQNSAAGTSRQLFNAQTKETNPKDLKAPTRDTGAIPKTRTALRKANSSNTIRTQKTKKADNKPLWR